MALTGTVGIAVVAFVRVVIVLIAKDCKLVFIVIDVSPVPKITAI